MIPVVLTIDEMEMAALVGVRRRIESLRRGHRERFGADKRSGWHTNIVGALGECAFAKAMNRHWAGGVNTFKDADIGTSVQVRTLARHSYDLTVRDDDADDQAFVLVTGEGPEFQVHGWVWGREARRDEWRKNYGGHGAAFFVPQAALRRLDI